MNKKLILGILSIIVGIVLMFTGYSITGAVVGFSGENYLGVVGIIAIISGGVLVSKKN